MAQAKGIFAVQHFLCELCVEIGVAGRAVLEQLVVGTMPGSSVPGEFFSRTS